MINGEASDCLACKLATGRANLPGGRIFETPAWLVEHCVGPMNVGTLVVKPRRHCTHMWDLTDTEAKELGPLLRAVATTVRSICQPRQVYVCLWSHAGWVPQHIHFLVQPVSDDLKDEFPVAGPRLQAEMFAAGVMPPAEEVEEFAARARELLAKMCEG